MSDFITNGELARLIQEYKNAKVDDLGRRE